MTDDPRKARVEQDAGRWKAVPPGARPEPEFVRKQKDMLRKLSQLLEVQISQDHATVAGLQEKVNRLKHGGGV
jgi:hypothetical protein